MTTPVLKGIRAVIFDVHGTLLAGGGPMRFDPAADLRIHELLNQRGCHLKGSPTRLLELAVKHHHDESSEEFPEVDLRLLWARLLAVEKVGTDCLIALERARQPLHLMPLARETLATLASGRLDLGLLSNAQADTLPELSRELGFNPFSADLCLLSYQHGIAKPSIRLFELLVARLAARGIPVEAVVMVGNDPRHDILPARKVGLRTVLFSGTAAHQPHRADAVIHALPQLLEILA